MGRGYHHPFFVFLLFFLANGREGMICNNFMICERDRKQVLYCSRPCQVHHKVHRTVSSASEPPSETSADTNMGRVIRIKGSSETGRSTLHTLVTLGGELTSAELKYTVQASYWKQLWEKIPVNKNICGLSAREHFRVKGSNFLAYLSTCL